jgi:ABC transporter substrate binding protein
MMHGHEKSRSAIVAVKPTNKAERTAAEPVERRAETKGSADQQRTRRTQRRISVSKMLARIRQHIAAVDTQGGNRMRESCKYGSVRGARGNSRPYRDRRDFIALLGGAAAWPIAARAQPPMPVVGYLSVGAPPAHLLAVFKQSLAQAGFVEGRNVAIETPSADGHYDRLPALAADLVRRQVAVIVAITANPALAAKEATATIPIVFNVPEDPVGLGLVASLARPGGNATGVSFLFSDLVAKHLGLLRELLPRAARIGLLVNPQNANVDILTKNATAAAASTGIEIIVCRASDAGAIEDAFATLARQRADALMVGADGYFFRRRWLRAACGGGRLESPRGQSGPLTLVSAGPRCRSRGPGTTAHSSRARGS